MRGLVVLAVSAAGLAFATPAAAQSPFFVQKPDHFSGGGQTLEAQFSVGTSRWFSGTFGNVTVRTSDPARSASGRVACLSVEGNQAVALTEVPPRFENARSFVGLIGEDNDQIAKSPIPDRAAPVTVSQVEFLPVQQACETALVAAGCATALTACQPLVQGNLTIKDRFSAGAA